MAVARFQASMDFQILRKLKNEIVSAKTAVFYLYFTASLLAFLLYKNLVLQAGSFDKGILCFSIIGVLSIAGLRITANKIPNVLRILLRILFSFFGVYILVTFPTFSLEGMPPSQVFLLQYGRYLVVFTAVMACFFPSLGLICLTYVVWYKHILTEQLGLYISSTDYLPLIEIGIFWIFGVLLYYLFCFSKTLKAHLTVDPKTPNQLEALEKMFLFGLAVHFSNYFYSGLKKINLGENVFDWPLYNDTGNLILNAMELKQLPLSFSTSLSAISYEAFEMVVVPANFIIFFGQLFAVFALCRINWALWTTIFYDLTHIIILICSGIFFYKWILLNTSVVIALKYIQGKSISPLTALSLMVIVICAPTIFFVAKLGWWDTPALNVERVSAITQDGRVVAVPTNFWGAFSVRLAQQRLIWDKSDGFFPTGTYGITLEQGSMEKAQNQGYQLSGLQDGDVIDNHFSKPHNDVSEFIKTYHAWAKENKGDNNNWFFDLYTHHIFSMPWEFHEFNNLDLNDIIAYRYSIEAVYLGYENGEFTRSVVRENHYDIPVGR